MVIAESTKRRYAVMKPHIDSTSFGSITIDGEKYDHDVMIRLFGKVKKRKKKLSKKVYGSSHTVSLDEAEYVYREGAKILVFGTGQNGVAKLSEEVLSQDTVNLLLSEAINSVKGLKKSMSE